MEKTNILMLLAAITISSITGSPTNDGRIVNGMEINIKQAPYLVRILFADQFCGGSLVASDYVVTAAHCIKGRNMTQFTIVANVTTTHEEGIRRTVSRWSIHPAYNRKSKHSDIAVLHLNEPIENIPTIELCEQPLKEGDSIQVSGWGAIEFLGAFSKTLRTVFLPVRSQESCVDEYKNFVKQDMICASGLTEHGICYGDSGGPAVYKEQLCGVVAFSHGCGTVEFKDVYTDVYAVKSFIQNFMFSSWS